MSLFFCTFKLVLWGKKKVGIDPSNSNEPNSAVINCINPQSPTQSRRINVTKPWTSKYSQPKRKL